MSIIWKIWNMRFVGNIIVSTKYEFYFDDVTVTSFIDIKIWWRCHSKYPVRNILFSFTVGKKDLAQMLFTLRCDQCIVKSVLQDQQCTFWSKKLAHSQESVVDKERPGRHQNNTAARSFLIDNTFLTISNLLHQACIAGFVKHLSLCTGHNSGWIMVYALALYALAFAHGKRITEYCSLRDTLNGNVAAFNDDKWLHSDVIVMKRTAGTQHKITITQGRCFSAANFFQIPRHSLWNSAKFCSIIIPNTLYSVASRRCCINW